MATRTRVKKEPAAGVDRLALQEVRAVRRDLEAGRLGRRAQPVSGSNAELLQEVNSIVETLAAPLGTAIDRVATLGRGEVPARIVEPWQGEFARLQEGLNSTVE